MGGVSAAQAQTQTQAQTQAPHITFNFERSKKVYVIVPTFLSAQKDYRLPRLALVVKVYVPLIFASRYHWLEKQ